MMRSASVIARPQRGRAGHAMARRASGSTFSISGTPCSARIASIPGRSAGLMSFRMMLCVGVSTWPMSNVSVSTRRHVFSRKSPSSFTRPLSTFSPRKRRPSPCSCQPIQSEYFHGTISRHGWMGLPRYDSTSERKPSMPSECTRYFMRAFARISRLPWSRCAARIALHTSKMSSLSTKPRWSAARANVVSLLCVRPMPPPTITLKPRRSSLSSVMTTKPMSLM
mmetsp:Transcript_24608/g.43806  ORF Transcript_24608/g.43806 Transcript_24608/m.43806 type:complete len:224 (+) Transcript_24608:702-1373(+)